VCSVSAVLLLLF
jgi:hypothetical protein